jgi:enoyl-CoA hydratase/carnithine racemase
MNTSIFGDVSVTCENNVGIAEIRRPPNNYFYVALVQGLVAAFEAFDLDAGCRAIVLASEGKSFCAGANFAQQGPGEKRPSGGSAGALYEIGARLFATRKPVIAAVQGAAIGGGFGLSLVADFRVVSPLARFSANFVKLGIHPGFGVTHALPLIIGRQRAAMMLYTGRRIDGEQAFEWGLADALVDPQNLRQEAIKLAAEIAENAPLAVTSTRATLRAGLYEMVAAQTKRELAEQTKLFSTSDYREGVRAVAERRPGRFVGA